MKIRRLIKFGLKFKNRIVTKHKNYPILCLLTRRCNLHCRYCNVINKNNKKELSVKEWKQIINNFLINGYIDFVFGGGEPLLYTGLGELIDYTSKRGMVSVVTNGTLLDEESIKQFRNLDHLVISCDSISNKISEKIILKRRKINMIKNFSKKFGFDVMVQAVITSKNIEEIPRLIKIFSNQGFCFSIQLIHSNKGDYWFRGFTPEIEFKTKQDKEKLREIQHILCKMKRDGYDIINPESYILNMHNYIANKFQINCKAGEDYFVVNNDGMVMPCQDILPSSFNALDLTKENYENMKKEVKKVKFKGCNCYYTCYYDTNFIEWLKQGFHIFTRFILK